ncbi:hypothetical protein D3C79_563490 [compost metagenome]
MLEGAVARIPGVDLALIILIIEQGQFGQALPRIGDHRLQQALPVAAHALDGGHREQVTGKSQCRFQLAAFLPGIQAQVELGGAGLPLDGTQGQAGSQLQLLKIGNLRLVVVHDLEQRRVTQAALRPQGFDQALERQVLVGLRTVDHGLERLQEGVHAVLAVHLAGHDLGIDEQAHQALHLAAVAVGDRRPDPQRGLAGIAPQQDLERGEQHGEQRHVVLPGELSGGIGQRGRHVEFKTLALVAGHGRADEIQRQFQHRLVIAQLPTPVVQLALLFARVHPAALPQGVVAVLDRQCFQARRLPFATGFVAAHELVDDDAHRPAIGDHMVQGQQQHMFTLGQGQQAHAQQGAVLKVERLQRLRLGLRRHLRLALVLGQCAQVAAGHRHIMLDGDLPQGAARLLAKHRAQRLVPRHQIGERRLQRCPVQLAFQANGRGQVVGTAVRVQLPEKPHPLLGVGELLTVFTLDPGRDRELGKIHAFLLQRRQKQAAFVRCQSDKPASELQRVLCIHLVMSGTRGCRHEGASSL